jgi:hypothetical protein
MMIGILVFVCQKNNFLGCLWAWWASNVIILKLGFLRFVSSYHTYVSILIFFFFYIWQIVVNIFDVFAFSCHVELQWCGSFNFSFIFNSVHIFGASFLRLTTLGCSCLGGSCSSMSLQTRSRFIINLFFPCVSFGFVLQYSKYVNYILECT